MYSTYLRAPSKQSPFCYLRVVGCWCSLVAANATTCCYDASVIINEVYDEIINSYSSEILENTSVLIVIFFSPLSNFAKLNWRANRLH